MMGRLRRLGGVRFGSKVRWAPVAALGVAGAVLASTVLASAASAPNLPKRTPAQLLAGLKNAQLPSAFSAVITESANLGFPALPDINGISSTFLGPAGLISGTHTVQVWYAGPRHVRIAVPVSFGETDLRVNGDQVWLWSSHGQTATRYILPASVGAGAGFIARGGPLPVSGPVAAATPARIVRLKDGRVEIVTSEGRHVILVRPGRLRAVALKARAAAGLPVALAPPGLGQFAGLTPLQAAQRLLAAIGPTTQVTVAGTTTVAGRPAYQLSIAPRTNQSLIDRILIAIDAKSSMPMQLQIFARGLSGPAFQVGFTSFATGVPATSNFAFTPPPGAHVKTVKLPAFPLGPAGIAPAPVPMPKRLVLPPRKPFHTLLPSRKVQVGLASPAPGVPEVAGPSAGIQVLGSGWLSVAVIPAGQLPGRHPMAPLQRAGAANSGQIGALIHTLLNSAAEVQGSWGSGRLLRTSLLSVLITSKGQILVGAVTPAVLYADAAKVK